VPLPAAATGYHHGDQHLWAVRTDDTHLYLTRPGNRLAERWPRERVIGCA
jgi:hypothetical protein